MARNGGGGRPLHLFDTWAGFPDRALQGQQYYDSSAFRDVSVDAVREFLAPFPNVEIRQGPIPDTFAPLEDRRFAFAHIDVDVYASAMDCCRFFHPRMVKGGVMLFDDYGFPAYRDAEKRAVDEFFAGKIEPTMVLRTGQCLVIKS
jgi:hypothetical protein